MIHHPKASMIGATTITKPRILPPKPPAAILPRLMEFQRLIAEGMTADAAMRQLEGSDGHKPKLPEHQISIQTGIPKPKRAPDQNLLGFITSEWASVRHIMAVSGMGKNKVFAHLRSFAADGVIEITEPECRKPMLCRLTAPMASRAITMRKNAQRASGGAVSRGNGQLEGGA